MNIPTSELAKISHVDSASLSGRFLASLTFYSQKEWEMWVPAGNELIKIKGWPAEAFYFSEKPEHEDDICSHFLNFLAQRANFSFIQKPYSGLVDDFYNLSAALAKLEHFFKHKDEIGSGVSRIVSTEIEYIFSVCRSIFDLLQEIIAKQWKNIRLLDENIEKRDLPETFSKAILFKGEPRTKGQFSERFGLPEQLDSFYCRYTNFFMSLRAFRDNVAHRGSSVDTIFLTEKGFAVSSETKPFSEYDVWTKEHQLPNDLCSLRPAIGYLIHQTLLACEDFSQTISTVIQFPEETVPGKHLFMRGFFGKHLISNVKAVQNNEWWDA